MKTLLSAQTISQRVDELGAEISLNYRNKPLTVVGLMTGSIIFLADLIRAITIPHRIALVRASSYRGETMTPDELKITIDPEPDIYDRDILVIDDIFDTGNTMEQTLHSLKTLKPKSMKSMVLLWKPSRTVVKSRPDYFGFEIADHFVVGYGLDYNDDYRHLPDIQIYDA